MLDEKNPFQPFFLIFQECENLKESINQSKFSNFKHLKKEQLCLIFSFEFWNQKKCPPLDLRWTKNQ